MPKFTRPKAPAIANNPEDYDLGGVGLSLANLNLVGHTPRLAPLDGLRPKKVAAKKRSKADRVQAVVDYFHVNYDTTANRLLGWQKFCEDVGVEVGSSIKQCKKNCKGVHMNIFEFVEAMEEGRKAKRFPSRQALAESIRQNKKNRFPLHMAKTHTVLRSLLVQVGEF